MGDEDTKNTDEVDKVTKNDLEMQLIPEEHNSEPKISEHQPPSIVENNEFDGEEYSCSPPKLFMPTIILLQIVFYILT